MIKPMKAAISLEWKKIRDGRTTLLTVITVAILLLLWIPAVVDKVLSFQHFRAGIEHQPLPSWLASPLIYTLPVLEATTIVLLLVDRTRRWGMWLSFLLMLAFTGYVGFAIAEGLSKDKYPCACGSVISGMTWFQHFWFNQFFLLVSAWGIYLTKKTSR